MKPANPGALEAMNKAVSRFRYIGGYIRLRKRFWRCVNRVAGRIERHAYDKIRSTALEFFR